MLSKPKSSLVLSYDLAVTNTTVDEEPPNEVALHGYLELLKILYTNGPRRFVLFTLPRVLGAPEEAQDLLRSYIETYNSGVESFLKGLKARHHGVRGQVFDTAPAFRKALGSLETYGALNATCFNSDGVSCLWTNYFHRGVAIQELVAEDLVMEIRLF